MHDDPIVSALVVLRPAPGRELGDQGPVTADTIDVYLPSAQAIAAAEEHFRRAGFSVGPASGVSFSITAPRSIFANAFGVRLTTEGDGQVKRARTERGDLELGISRLPQGIRDIVQTVTFAPPPDFGPTGYS